jgi:Na+/proline symporter
MLLVAWLLQYDRTGAVNINLAIVGIFDMPLFVITVIYGLFWKRANWQGATAGFIAGGAVGVMTYVILEPQVNHYVANLLGGGGTFLTNWHGSVRSYSTWVRAAAPITSSCTALIVTPIVSLLTAPNRRASAEQIRAAFNAGGNGADPAAERDETSPASADHDTFDFVPRSALGRAGAAHWVIDETTAMAVSAPDRELGRLAFWVTGATIYLGWNATTLLGALGAGALGGTAQAALDSVVPAAFLALLWPRLRRGAPEAPVQRRVALGGAVVALALTPYVPAGVQVILAVVAVALAGRPRRTPAEEPA